MKLNRTTLFIAVSALALIGVLIIQVNWIVQTAKVKEELFNEKANMVLSKTSEAISANEPACTGLERGAGESEMQFVDSLFKHYMKFYDFQIEYTFEFVQPNPFTANAIGEFTSNVYNKRVDGVTTKNGLELKLVFPEKRQFIIAEMGPLFITSIVLILVVMVLFRKTYKALSKEKRIVEHTTDFLNNMTHEFKTPLTNIALAGRMIAKDASALPEDKIRHYTSIILRENEKLRLQVEQVLSMTALERGEIPLQKTELDFHFLLQDAVKCMSLQLENKNGRVNLQLNAEHFVVMGDPTHFTNTICNLIDNAIKYSKERPEITIRTNDSGGRLVLEVSDQGIGIEKEFQQKVFDSFFRVPTGNRHDVKGFGLGLAYVKKIVELHGGTIQLESEKGKGVTFTIILPYA